MQALSPLQCQTVTALGTGDISTFWKNWVQLWGEYFLKFGVNG